jgi:hypothetical protein
MCEDTKRRFRIEGAREDRERPKDGSFVSGEERIAPLERDQQRLLPQRAIECLRASDCEIDRRLLRAQRRRYGRPCPNRRPPVCSS